MSCRLLFVRHGQSLGNLTGRFLGITDLDLSPLGAVQARRTADYLKDEKIDVIYASDLIRACHTAQPLSEIKGLPIIKDKRLEEINAGLWENRTFDDLEKEFPESYEGVWLHDIGNSKADGGESVAHLTDRIYEAVHDIAMKNDGKTVAIFSHATPIRAFFCRIYGYSLSEMVKLPWPTNASVSEAVFESGKSEPVRYSYDEFMGELSTALPKNC